MALPRRPDGGGEGGGGEAAADGAGGEDEEQAEEDMRDDEPPPLEPLPPLGQQDEPEQQPQVEQQPQLPPLQQQDKEPEAQEAPQEQQQQQQLLPPIVSAPVEADASSPPSAASPAAAAVAAGAEGGAAGGLLLNPIVPSPDARSPASSASAAAAAPGEDAPPGDGGRRARGPSPKTSSASARSKGSAGAAGAAAGAAAGGGGGGGGSSSSTAPPPAKSASSTPPSGEQPQKTGALPQRPDSAAATLDEEQRKAIAAQLESALGVKESPDAEEAAADAALESAPLLPLSAARGARLLVRGAGMCPEVNGPYTLEKAPPVPGQRPTYRLMKERGTAAIVTWTKKAVPIKEATDKKPRRSHQCIISVLKRDKTGKEVFQPQYEADLAPSAGGVGALNLPLSGWRLASASNGYSGGIAFGEPSLEFVDIGSFKKLRKAVGWQLATLLELRALALHELSSNFHDHRAGGKKKVMSLEEAEDGEVFEVGRTVIVHEDEDFAKLALEKAGIPWDPRLPFILGSKSRVLEVPSADRVVIQLPKEFIDEHKLELPAVMLDIDYTDIWSFYNSWPVFIVLQTITCVTLWLWFALRDAGRGGRPFTLTMGGLEAAWPGWTSLHLTSDCEDYRWQIWRWFSYQFSHVGLGHISTNALINVVLGVPLERFHGTPKMLLMYELGVFGGACAYLIADGHRPVVGTSGGCFALIGIRVGDLIMNWNERPYRYYRLVFLTFIICANIAVELYLNEPEGGVSTSNAAHVGGGLAGLLAAVVFGRNLKRERWERAQILVAALLLVAGTCYCLVRGLQWPPQNIFEDTPWCWMRQVSNASVTAFGGSWDWRCVRCHSEACIEGWSSQRRIYKVIEEMCLDGGGFAYTEPAPSSWRADRFAP